MQVEPPPILHVIPSNNKPATIHWEQIPCDVCATKNGFFIMVLGTRLQGYDVTSRALGQTDFLFLISDF